MGKAKETIQKAQPAAAAPKVVEAASKSSGKLKDAKSVSKKKKKVPISERDDFDDYSYGGYNRYGIHCLDDDWESKVAELEEEEESDDDEEDDENDDDEEDEESDGDDDDEEEEEEQSVEAQKAQKRQRVPISQRADFDDYNSKGYNRYGIHCLDDDWESKVAELEEEEESDDE